VLAQITSCSEFGDDMPSYIPINDYVTKAISQFTAWLLEGRYSLSVYEIMQLNGLPVADVPDAETQYHAHEFLDVTVQPRPIYISPNEVYAMHGLLAQHIDRLVRYLCIFARPTCAFLTQPFLRIRLVTTLCELFSKSSMVYRNWVTKNSKMLEIGQSR
jgi:hypothetical protein